MSTDKTQQQPEAMPSSSSAAAQRGGSQQSQSQSQPQQQETNNHSQQQTSPNHSQSQSQNHAQQQQESQPTQDQTQTQSNQHPESSQQPPPPPPPPPTEQQPAQNEEITPGPRALRLQQLFTTTLRHTLDKISLDNFSACYPTITSRAPGTLEFVQRQMVERLGVQCNKEFNSILQAREVVPKLNELEGLVGEAGRRRRDAAGSDASPPIPPHTLPPTTILQAHLAPHLASTQNSLTSELRQTQAENHALFNEIQAQRAEIEELLGIVEKALKDVEGANELLGQVVEQEGDSGLAEEIRGVDGEISGRV